ncbi:D-threonate kinase [Paenibacillus vulneris]|uniref:Four-carbon acid sugar kinase family protein n=1 Tax=Paenibacillus vulneris TaxID=1133364 RepID=A0ABW3URW7_9BACL
MLRLAIIADDLTGASDSGVQVARKGLPTQVVFDWSELNASTSIAETIVLDTDSRSVPGELAYQRVREAAASLKEQGCAFIYKKLDSTLRGNLGQEIEAVLDVYGFEGAIVVPAFPRIGRTTVGGRHYLNGVPIHETEIGRDPKTPVPEADISKLLSGQARRTAVSIPLAAVREGLSALEESVNHALKSGAELLVIDAETDEDLQQIAELMPKLKERLLWAGSAGLAEYLPLSSIGMVGSDTSTEGADVAEAAADAELKRKVQRGRQPVMLVAGSISRVTRAQVQKVNEHPDVACVELDPLTLLASPEQAAQEKEHCYRSLSSALNAGSDVSFYAGSSPEQVAKAQKLGFSRGMDASSVSNAIADALGEVAAAVCSAYTLQGMVLTGGDTAKAVCRHLGVRGIELTSELEPGIPLGRLIGARNVPTVTKAGAFGNVDSLWHAMQILKGEYTHE